jgi:hypothetical protein
MILIQSLLREIPKWLAFDSENRRNRIFRAIQHHPISG